METVTGFERSWAGSQSWAVRFRDASGIQCCQTWPFFLTLWAQTCGQDAKKYDFSYMLYGNRYQVELLFFILFFFPGRPWLAPKYAKRVARSILFEFYWLIDQYTVGSDSLKKIKDIFRNMSSEMLAILIY